MADFYTDELEMTNTLADDEGDGLDGEDDEDADEYEDGDITEEDDEDET